MPDNFLYIESRELFKQPNVITDRAEIETNLKWNKPNSEGLNEFLVGEKGFQEAKVVTGLTKLQNSLGKVNQSRLDLFFKSSASTQPSTPGTKGRGAAAATANKRKASISGRGRGKK